MNKLSGDIYYEFVRWTFKKLGIYIGIFMTPSWRTGTAVPRILTFFYIIIKHF